MKPTGKDINLAIASGFQSAFENVSNPQGLDIGDVAVFHRMRLESIRHHFDVDAAYKETGEVPPDRKAAAPEHSTIDVEAVPSTSLQVVPSAASASAPSPTRTSSFGKVVRTGVAIGLGSVLGIIGWNAYVAHANAPPVETRQQTPRAQVQNIPKKVEQHKAQAPAKAQSTSQQASKSAFLAAAGIQSASAKQQTPPAAGSAFLAAAQQQPQQAAPSTISMTPPTQLAGQANQNYPEPNYGPAYATQAQAVVIVEEDQPVIVESAPTLIFVQGRGIPIGRGGVRGDIRINASLPGLHFNANIPFNDLMRDHRAHDRGDYRAIPRGQQQAPQRAPQHAPQQGAHRR